MRTAASLVLIPLVALGVRSCTDVEMPSPNRLSPNTAQGQVQLDVFTDFPTFEATPGRLVEIDFEDQPIDGSSRCSPDLDPFCTPIPNPLVLEAVFLKVHHGGRVAFPSPRHRQRRFRVQVPPVVSER